MSCNKCNTTTTQILPEGTEDAYASLLVGFGNFFKIFYNELDVKTLEEIRIAIENEKDYVKARQKLLSIANTFKDQLSTIQSVITLIKTDVDKCLNLPLPKNTIKPNSYMQKTYQQPTMCSCATCQYVVRSDFEETQGDEAYVYTKFACNYENRLVEAKLSGNYTKEEIFDQLSVDEQGKCACYEFGNQTEYDDIGDPIPESGTAGVAPQESSEE